MDEPARTILAVDVGNSTTVVGVVRTATLAVETTLRLNTDSDRTPDEWRALFLALVANDAFGPGSIQGAVISSVVPRVTRSLTMAIGTWLGVPAVAVDATNDLGIAVAVDHPLEVGADRLVNAVAARRLVGCPAIVVDAGTATKVDVLSRNGAFIGGAIAPGIDIGLDALAGRAARLYAVELSVPERAIGRNTIEAVQSGLIFGHAAMIEGMVARCRGEVGEDAPVIFTGGFGQLMAGAVDMQTRVEPILTLTGASIVWMREARRNDR